MNALKVYKSSAGSGKTFILVKEFLRLTLQQPEDYKSVLAITFTNKAAEEMKSRIIDALVSIDQDEDTPMRSILEGELPGIDLKQRAGKVLKNILHDYSSFSVSTIDSFFQRIMRSLAREINVPVNMEVQVEVDDAILEVTDRLLKEVGVDEELTKWLTELALQKIDDDKGWNLEHDIATVAWEIYNEGNEKTSTLSREEIQVQYKKLQFIRRGFEQAMKETGERALSEMSANGYSVSDFAHGKAGVANYFEKIVSGENSKDYIPGKRVLEAVADGDKWASKTSPARIDLINLANGSLIGILQQAIAHYDEHYRKYLTATEILKKIFLFGIINDLLKKFAEYRNENNIILLSDTPRLLLNMISENDTPFIYEKTGNKFKHLLIDEFQDTSVTHWRNLLPLVINSLGSGFMTLIVGDAKQSIYRWRGGTSSLLLEGIFSDLKNFSELFKEQVLSVNYRSRQTIVSFNNNFFTKANATLEAELADIGDFKPLKLAYSPDLAQSTFGKNEGGGYVRIKFLSGSEDQDGEMIGWKENALNEMFDTINQLLAMKYSYRDICILVRTNTDGNEIANWLFNKGIEEIISPDSLLIAASPKIDFVINIFKFLVDRNNHIARSEIVYFYRRFVSKKADENWHRVFIDHKNSRSKSKKSAPLFEGLEENLFNSILPQSFTSQLSSLSKMPVYELSEQIIGMFELNKVPDGYIQCFQDLVLEYTIKSNSSLEGFLHWWENSKVVRNASIIIPESTNAIRIMTIHKSKGLQFPVVIMPFCEWRLLPKPNEILWMSTKDSPFEELGNVAVNSSQKLKDTYFREEYIEEQNQTITDNMNLLYVAFTRAESMLFVFSPEDKNKELKNVSSLINRICRKIDSSFSNIFEAGSFHDKEVIRKKEDVVPEYLSSYPSNRWQDKLTLGMHAPDLLALLESGKMSKINYGILVHSILASINTIEESDSMIERVVFEGLIASTEKEKLKKEIQEVLNVPEIRSLFDPAYEVLNERNIILPGGEILRPDRIISRNEHAIVIDFKTGRHEKKHEQQVRRYAEVLQSMNYQVTAKIVYLTDRKVVEVKIG